MNKYTELKYKNNNLNNFSNFYIKKENTLKSIYEVEYFLNTFIKSKKLFNLYKITKQ